MSEVLEPLTRPNDSERRGRNIQQELLLLQRSISIAAGQTTVVVTPQQLAPLRLALGQGETDTGLAATLKQFEQGAQKLGVNMTDLRSGTRGITLTEAQLKGWRTLAEAFGPLPEDPKKTIEEQTHKELEELNKVLTGKQFEQTLKALSNLPNNEQAKIAALVAVGVFFILLMHRLERRDRDSRIASAAAKSENEKAQADFYRAQAEVIRKTQTLPGAVPVAGTTLNQPNAPRRSPPYSADIRLAYQTDLRQVAVQDLVASGTAEADARRMVEIDLTVTTNEQGDMIFTISVELRDRLRKANPQTPFRFADAEHGFALHPRQGETALTMLQSVVTTESDTSRVRFQTLLEAVRAARKRTA
ncbi:hypothetical protein HYW84_02705 [Candidatus Peregrinibacteria bacterium]|nr:hypothetical protein [Candidatus Peregrinibacteria bacterium]